MVFSLCCALDTRVAVTYKKKKHSVILHRRQEADETVRYNSRDVEYKDPRFVRFFPSQLFHRFFFRSDLEYSQKLPWCTHVLHHVLSYGQYY